MVSHRHCLPYKLSKKGKKKENTIQTKKGKTIVVECSMFQKKCMVCGESSDDADESIERESGGGKVVMRRFAPIRWNHNKEDEEVSNNQKVSCKFIQLQVKERK